MEEKEVNERLEEEERQRTIERLQKDKEEKERLEEEERRKKLERLQKETEELKRKQLEDEKKMLKEKMKLNKKMELLEKKLKQHETTFEKKLNNKPTPPKKRKTPIPKSLKISVWDKHIGDEVGKSKCLCCDTTNITQMNFHCGHIIAEAMGGKVHINNLLPICNKCNRSMGTRNLHDFKKEYYG